MPIISQDDLINRAGGEVEKAIAQAAPEEVPNDPRSFMDNLGAGLVSNNLFAKAAAKMQLAPDLPLHSAFAEPADPNFKLTDEDMQGYEDFWDNDLFLSVNNQEQLRQAKRVVDFNRNATEDARNGGWAALAGSIAGELADPTILVPGGLAVKAVSKSATITKSALASGGLLAGAEAAQEAAILGVDPTKKLADSATEVALVGTMGLVFGGVVGAMSTSARTLAKEELRGILGEASGLELKVNDGKAAFHKSASSAGAGVTDVALKDINDRLARFLSSPLGEELMSPAIRGLTHSVSAVRKVTDELFEHGLEVSRTETRMSGQVGAAEAAPSVETLMRIDDLAYKNVNRDITNLYKQHAGLSPDSFGGSARAFYRSKTSDEVLSYTRFDEEVSKAIRNGGEHQIPEVALAAKRYREEFDKLAARMQEVDLLPEGLTVKGASAYFPRRYNVNKILKEIAEATAEGRVDNFTQTIANHFQAKNPALDAEEALFNAEQTVARITKQDDAALEFQHMMDTFDVKTSKRLDKGRVLDLEDSVLEPWLENSAADVFNQYAYQASSMVRYKEWLNSKGADGFADLIKEVDDEIASKLKDGSISAEGAIKMKKDAEEMLTKSINSILGRLTDKKSYGKPVPTVVRNLRKALAQAQLGGVAISSLADPLIQILRTGPISTLWDGHIANLRRIGKSITNSKGKSVSLRTELNDQLRDLAAGIEIEESKLIKMMLEPGEPLGVTKGKTEQFLEASSQVFGRASGLAYWNNSMKRIAAHSSLSKSIRDMRKLASGKTLSGADAARLSKLRIDSPEMQQRILKQIDAWSESYSGTTLPNMHLWKDQQAKEAFQSSVISEIESSVITPGKGDLPFLMQESEVAKTLLMYKSFSASATNKILISSVQRRDARVAGGILSLVMMGSMVGMLKDLIAGREPNYDVETRLKEGVSRSGVLGLQGDMLFGMYGALSDSGTYSRYAGQRGVDILLGPTFGLLKDTMDVASVALSDAEGKEFDAKTARKIVKYLPYNNLFYLQNIIKKSFEEE